MKAPVKSGTQIELVPEDSYQAVCFAVYDLGTAHHDGMYPGERREVLLIFEIPEQRIEIERDGKKIEYARSVSKKYTFSMSEKANLRKDMETWRGKGFTELEAIDFEFKDLLGANAIIQIIHQSSKADRVYAKIASITKLLKGMEKKEPERQLSFFCFDDGMDKLPEEMPQWIKNIIVLSNEYGYIMDAREDTGEQEEPSLEPNESGEPKNDDDDLPF